AYAQVVSTDCWYEQQQNMYAASCRPSEPGFWHKNADYAKHGAFRTISSAFVRRCIARLFAAINLAVRIGDPKATRTALRLSRPPLSSSARFKFGNTRSRESDTTRRTATGTPALAAASTIE